MSTAKLVCTIVGALAGIAIVAAAIVTLVEADQKMPQHPQAVASKERQP